MTNEIQVLIQGNQGANKKSLFHDEGIPMTDIFPRSRLYHLAPLGVGTPFIESLTSYINRLAWAYRISARVLSDQEIVPSINGKPHVGSFSGDKGKFYRTDARGINGFGEIAVNWAYTLEQLTMRTDLQALTLRLWGGKFSNKELLRRHPAWCPVCYYEWTEKEHRIYQPLLWMLQIVTLCPSHMVALKDQCSSCQREQSFLAHETRLGYCTQCSAWLGSALETIREDKIDEETIAWQKWVVTCIDELHQTSSISTLPWKQLSVGLSTCIRAEGSTKQFAKRTNVSENLIQHLMRDDHAPSLERLLALCYSIDISPFQLMVTDPLDLKEMMRTRKANRQPREKRRTYPKLDRERALEFIHTVLENGEKPLKLIQVSRHLGVFSSNTLTTHFPQESALIVAQYRAYQVRKKEQRLAQTCNEVRQAVFTLQAQGLFPSVDRVTGILPNPNVMARPEAQNTFHAVRRELGIE